MITKMKISGIFHNYTGTQFSKLHEGLRRNEAKMNPFDGLLFSPSLCTPPIPPVTNTSMPALWAHSMVADTVVPPQWPCKRGHTISSHDLTYA